ncbi:hypothetical protein C8J57DRAFT_1717891 [Mycena rebaudengoi]|nr:hypothetical protein C8J57DRAFT_1717891 [Mycena rebaudengoi]
MEEIFMHYVDKSLIRWPQHSMNPDSPLRLASVCSVWRKVALSSPHLWAVLRLIWDSLSATRREQLLHCWLSRAGGCLLDLQLKGRHLTPAISGAIAHHAPQLRRLTIGSHLASQFSQLCFPALEALDVQADQWGFLVTNITAFIGEAPQLREVSFSVGSPSLAKLPWNQITSLDLLHRPPSLEVLKQAPNLEMLSFTTSGEDFDDTQTLIPIVMTKLHTLIIYPSSYDWNHPLFNHLTLPALRALEFGHLDIEQLRALVRRSACAIIKMHLHDQTAAETIGYLDLSESIERLTLAFSGDALDDVVAESSYCEELFGFLSRGVLPALKTLSFDGFPMAVEASILQFMLCSRREIHGVANLELFRLRFNHSVRGCSEYHVSQLHALIAQGLYIHIEWAAGEFSQYVNPELVSRINAAS